MRRSAWNSGVCLAATVAVCLLTGTPLEAKERIPKPGPEVPGAGPSGLKPPPEVGLADPSMMLKIPKADLLRMSSRLRFPVGDGRPGPNDAPTARLGDGSEFTLLRRDQVEEGERIAGALADSPAQAALRVNLQNLLRHLPPPAADNLRFQTPIRHQGGRGSCTYFSTLAALEAAYRRQGGEALDLSEQYLVWLRDVTLLAEAGSPKAPSQTDPSKRECQVGSLTGGGSVHNLKLMTRHGVCREEDSKYIGDPAYERYREWPSYADFGLTEYTWRDTSFPQDPINRWNFAAEQYPAAARNNARYGVDEFAVLRREEARNTGILEALIAAGHDVIVDMGVSTAPAVDPARPVWHTPAAAHPDGHSMLFVGYDRARRFFVVKNSWGSVHYAESDLAEGWKDITRFEGYTLIGYDHMATASNASYIVQPAPSEGGKYDAQRVLGFWDVRFSRASTGQEVATCTLAWRHLPNTWWDSSRPDRRVGDFTCPDGGLCRVNADFRPGDRGLTLFIDFDRPGTRYDELRGVRMVGEFGGYGKITGVKILNAAGEARGELFTVPLGDLTFSATHRHP